MIRMESQTLSLFLGTLIACSLTGSLFAAPLALPALAAEPAPLAPRAALSVDDEDELPDKREEIEEAIDQLGGQGGQRIRGGWIGPAEL